MKDADDGLLARESLLSTDVKGKGKGGNGEGSFPKRREDEETARSRWSEKLPTERERKGTPFKGAKRRPRADGLKPCGSEEGEGKRGHVNPRGRGKKGRDSRSSPTPEKKISARPLRKKGEKRSTPLSARPK